MSKIPEQNKKYFSRRFDPITIRPDLKLLIFSVFIHCNPMCNIQCIPFDSGAQKIVDICSSFQTEENLVQAVKVIGEDESGFC